MCRIFGASFGDELEDLDASEIAAILAPALVGQGPDAYGWMTSDGEEITYHKFAGRSDTTEARENILRLVDPKPRWLIGHLRWATHGSPKAMINNHPIPHGNVIGVHNGVLSNYAAILSVTGREDPKAEVDSEAIFAAVNRWGPSPGLRKMRGSMVAVYSDYRKPHLLHIARSNGRNLTIGWTTKGNLIFASDQSALMKLTPMVEFKHFSQISENRLLIVRNGKIIQRHTFASPAPMYVPPPASVTRVADADWERWFFDRSQSDRASKRGAILFPKGQPEKAGKKHKKRKDKFVRREAPRQNQKLWYANGVFMTHTEWVEHQAEAGPFNETLD